MNFLGLMSDRTKQRGPRSLQPDLAGAGLLWMFGACGVAVSVLLTLLKFRSAYGCDVSLLSACQIGGVFSCNRVLQSDWATTMGVPISVLATAHYGVLIGLATCVLAWPGRYLVAVRPLVLWIAWAGLAVVPPLFAYSLLVAQGLCSYCLVVYAINVAIFLVAWWMHPEGLGAGLWAWFRGSARGAAPSIMAGLSFVALVLTQMVVYQDATSSIETKVHCLRDGELPDTSLHTDASEPQVEVALFIDLACPMCQDEFNKWWQYVAASEGSFRLALYHFPREGDCQPYGEKAFNLGSEQHHSCLAARAVECAENRRPGAGLELVKRLFAVQDNTKGPYFTRERLVAFARELAVPGAEDGSFLDCVETNSVVLSKIHEHVQFAADHGLAETPGAFFAFHDDGKVLPQLYLVKGSKSYPNVRSFLHDARAEVRRSLGLDHPEAL